MFLLARENKALCTLHQVFYSQYTRNLVLEGVLFLSTCCPESPSSFSDMGYKSRGLLVRVFKRNPLFPFLSPPQPTSKCLSSLQATWRLFLSNAEPPAPSSTTPTNSSGSLGGTTTRSPSTSESHACTSSAPPSAVQAPDSAAQLLGASFLPPAKCSRSIRPSPF